jgi:uncharacterized membrane protein
MREPRNRAAMTVPLPALQRLCVASLAALIGIEVLWELWLAPLAHAGWLALKALPLALLWQSVAHGRRRALQWTLLLLPWYLAEALVRAWSESGRGAACAIAAATMALVALGTGLLWARSSIAAESASRRGGTAP